MTDPSRTPAASDKADTNSQGPLDHTLSRPEGTVAEPNFAAPAHAGEVGQLGRYRVLQKLGAGGMGAVYLGYDSALDRKVALKVMLPQHATDPESRERFLREARAAAKVHSDHVVTIHDVGEERGVPFIAMEYLLGAPLDQFLKTKGDLALPQALRVVRETALGLSAAHQLGLIHRDIKPGNIWLEAPKGRVKILDFGLARPANDDAHLTGSGAVMGTPAYMSPEQGRGLKVDRRSDLFSLGVVLYRLTTGKMPFTGDSMMAVLTSLAVDTPVPPRQHNPQVPEAVEAVINKLLAKNPAERFQSAKEVIDALTEIERPRSGSGQLPVVVATPVPPLVVGAQTQNVWEGIEASESVPVPLADAEPSASVVPVRPERKAPKWPLFAALAALLAAVAVVAVVVMSLPKKPEGVQKEDPPAPRPPVPPPSGKPPAGAVPALPTDMIAAMTPVKPEKVFTLDHLDPANPKHIPPEEKFDWQPKELVAVLGSHRQRMPTGPTVLLVSPNGDIVQAGGPQSHQVFNIATGNPVNWPLLHGCTFDAFSPDGKRIALWNQIREIADLKKPPVEYPIPGSIWAFLTPEIVLAGRYGEDYGAWKLDLKDPKLLVKFPRLFASAISNNRKYFAVVSRDDPSCRVFDITADGPQEKFSLPGSEGRVRVVGTDHHCISLSDTGLLVTLDPGGVVRVWDIAGEKPRLRHTIEEKDLGEIVCLFPNGDRVIRAGHNGFEVWSIDGEKPQKVATSRPDYPFDSQCLCLAVTPDGKTVITGHANGTVRFWGIEKGRIVERNPLKPQPMVLPFADLSPDGRFAALGHEDGQNYLWDLATLTSRSLGAPQNQPVRFRLDGGAVCAPGAGVGVLRLFAPPDAPAPVGSDFSAGTYPGCFSPDGKWLASYSERELVVWDVSAAPREKWRVPGHWGHFWRFTPDGRYLIALAPPDSGTAKVWAMTARGPVPRFEAIIRGFSGAISPDGKAVAICKADGPLVVYSVKDGTLEDPREHLGTAAWADFSPDGRTLLVGGFGAGLKLLDAASGKVLRAWTLRGEPMGGRFHPDGKHVFVTNADKTTYILRLLDPDRKAAEYVLSIGGLVRINGVMKDITVATDLPKERFSLTWVDLKHNKSVNDAGLASFKHCTKLVFLEMRGAAVGDAGMAHFKDCKELRHLDLGGTQVSDAGLANFKGCSGLTFLSLYATQVSDAGLAHLKEIKSFTTLYLSRTKVGDAGLANFKDCRDLKALYVGETGIGNATLTHFEGHEKLQELQVTNTNVTVAAVAKFAKARPECLISYDGGLIEPKVVADPDRRAAEFAVSIGGTVRVNGDDKELKSGELPKDRFTLRRMDLAGTGVSDAGLVKLKGCKDLVHLDLNRTPVTDAGLTHIKDCKGLTSLELRQTKVTKEGVAEVAKALPKCRIVWDGGTIEPKK